MPNNKQFSPKAAEDPDEEAGRSPKNSPRKPAGGGVGPGCKVEGNLEGNCIHCKVAMGSYLGILSPEGPIHNECVAAYRRAHIERCAHCDNVLGTQRTLLTGIKLHPGCLDDFKAKKQYVPPTKEGTLKKFSIGKSSFFSKSNWNERYFVITKEKGLQYFEDQKHFQDGKAEKGSILISPETTRMVTRPTKMIFKEASNPSTQILIVFLDEGTERRLLLQAKDYKEHDAWVEVLQCYIKFVDDPRDLVD